MNPFKNYKYFTAQQILTAFESASITLSDKMREVGVVTNTTFTVLSLRPDGSLYEGSASLPNRTVIAGKLTSREGHCVIVKAEEYQELLDRTGKPATMLHFLCILKMAEDCLKEDIAKYVDFNQHLIPWYFM